MNYEPLVRSWVSESLSTLESEPFVKADFDVWTGEAISVDVAKRALGLFGLIVEGLARVPSSAVAMLRVPLPASQDLVVDPPDLYTSIETRPADVFVPPSFYLSRPESWSDWGDFEVFRKPVAPLKEFPFASAYYGTERTTQGRESGWEYSRAFYFLGH